MQAGQHLPEDPERGDWDVVVIGTGMGGATIGCELARRGRRVLFLEKGMFLQRDEGAVRGDLNDQGVQPDERLRRGRWPFPIEGVTTAGDVEFFAPLGCGTGGSTVLYAATLERFFPSDFRPREHFPEAADSTAPEAWPITYEELEPYYARAEELFRVRGTLDPLHPGQEALPEPPPMSERDRSVEDLFRRQGLHPYRVHVGCRFLDDCDGCGGVRCVRDCKSDSGNVCLLPALDTHGAKLLPECEVTKLQASATSVQQVHCRLGGRDLRIRAKKVILAAGALMTPVLLLNSRNQHWTDGLANRSGLVGRNLMVHSGDMIAVRPDHGGATEGPGKSLSLNDLYFADGRKCGNLQSVGIRVSTGAVLAHLTGLVDKSPHWWRKLATRRVLQVGALVGAFYFRNSVVFGSIVEDLPYYANRVLPDPRSPNGMRFEYGYPRELAERNEIFRRNLAHRLGRRRVVTLTRGENLNFGHSCGTCRFGDDPETSVLDRNNRAHGVENLYVVDASFFPSSGGTNPSLTIAANALRVADVVDGEL